LSTTELWSQPERAEPTAEAYVDVTRRDGLVSRRQVLRGHHMRIGRSPKAAIVLEHSTVSFRHAELVLDPFGHWWVYDLASTNGTRVNGVLVKERMLNPGDRIDIGDFVLCLRLTTDRRELDSAALEVDEEPPTDRGRERLITMTPEPDEVPRINAALLSKVMAFGRQLLTVEEASARLDALCEFAVGSDFPADSAVVVRLEEGEPTRLVLGPFQRNPEATKGRHMSHGVLSSLWKRREPVLATNLPVSDKQLGVGTLTMPAQERALAVVACPLYADQETIDALYVELPPWYATVEWLTLVTLLADAHQQAELAWEVRNHLRISAIVERELMMARQIQHGLVPRYLRFEGLDVAIGFEPCRWVGGDYVDAITMMDGRVLLAIADVCGKGLQAALVASSLHTIVHATVHTARSLARLVDNINDYLCNYLPDHSFVTMTCIAIDPWTGEVECVNAGHPPAFAVGPHGALRQLQAEQNTALGLLKMPMAAEGFALAHDEVLVLYTDGLTELPGEDGQALGEDRLAAGLSSLVATHPTASVHTTRHQLTEMLDAFRGQRVAADDCTFLIARRTAAGRPPPAPPSRPY